MRGALIYSNFLAAQGEIDTTSGTGLFLSRSACSSPNPNYFWEPLSYSGTIYLRCDLGSACAVSGWGLLNHTLSDSEAWVSLACGNPDDGSTFNLTVSSFILDGHPEYQPHVAATTSPEYTKRYWRVQVTNATSMFQIGTIFLGTHQELEETPDSIRQRPAHYAARSESSGGRDSRAVFGRPQSTFDVGWRSASPEMAEFWQTIQETQKGKRDPFIFVSHEESGTSEWAARYVRLMNLKVSEQEASGRFQIAATLRDVGLQ